MSDLDAPIETIEDLQRHPEVKRLIDGAVSAAVRDHKERTRSKYGDYDELVKFRDEATDSLSKATDRISELETGLEGLQSQLAQKDVELVRQRVAEDKKVPARWILGSTEDEMKASADAWLQDVADRSKPEPIPSQRTGGGDLGISTFDAGREAAEKRFKIGAEN